jgi:hypothetical protein
MRTPPVSLVLLIVSSCLVFPAVALGQLSPTPKTDRTRPRQLPLSGPTQAGKRRRVVKNISDHPVRSYQKDACGDIF